MGNANTLYEGDKLIACSGKKGLRYRKFSVFLILGMIVSSMLIGLLMLAPTATAEPELDFIIIRDAPNNGGNPIGNMTYNLGETDTFYAAGYNITTGYIDDVDVGWEVARKYVGTVTGYGNSTTFTPTAPGSTYITAFTDPTREAGIENNTGMINVFNHSIDYIIIHELGDDDWVGDRSYYAGEWDTFFAAGFNDTYGYQGSYAVIWTSSDPNVCTITRFAIWPDLRAIDVGACNITADFGSGITNTTGTFTVGPGIDFITIRDAPNNAGNPVGNRTYNLGDTDTFYGAGYNNTAGYVGDDFDKHWFGKHDPPVGNLTGNGNPVTFTATGPGSMVICVHFRSWMAKEGADNVKNQTGAITVFNNSIDQIIIRNRTRGNGVWIDDRTYYEGDIDMFFAAGYNDTYGYEGDFAVTWASSDTNVCTIIRSELHPFGAELKAIGVGTCNITADFGGGITNVTDAFTVGPRIDYIIIRDAPNGTGGWIDDRSYETVEIDKFYAAGYNNTLGYLDDVEVYWFSEFEEVARVNPEEGKTIYYSSSVTFEPLYNGSTWIRAYYYRDRFHPGYDYLYNTTGELKINSPPDITVDDSGGADYYTIQEAIDAADPGGKIFVHEGVYDEHVNVYKRLKIIGEDRNNTIIDGSNSGIVVLINADDVVFQEFTIRNGEYGAFLDKTKGTEISFLQVNTHSYGIFNNHTESTKILHCLVKNYDYGIYNNYTKDSLIVFNDVTNGKYGIVTYEASDDAVNWNTISYNTVYGAKDFNSERSGCFNWNYFHHNKIAYWYDPTKGLYELEFDSNLIEYNEIGVKVSDASTVRITNNTITNGDYGIYLDNASPWIYENILENNKIGIYCSNSNSTIENNRINNTNYGIYSNDSSSDLIKNTIKESSEIAIFVERADFIIIADNVVDEIVIYNSTVEDLSLINTEAMAINSTILNFNCDTQSKLITKWFLRIRIEDSNGFIVNNATVKIQDIFGNEIKILQTGSDGWTDPIALIEYILDLNGQTYHTPHMVLVEKKGAKCEETVIVNRDKSLVVTLEQLTPTTGGEFPWLLLLVFGSVSVVGAGCLLGTEIGKFALLSLFIPLYMKIKKEKVLDHYDRGRVYQYIELNPGEHYNSIKKALGLNNGALTYHLYVLEKVEKIKSRQDGIYKRFYSYTTTVPQNNGGVLTEVQKRIVDSIRDLPSVTQKELASVLGLRQSTLSYQLTKLESKGIISSTRKGKNTCYHLKL